MSLLPLALILCLVVPFLFFCYGFIYSSLNSSAKDKIGRYQINWQYERLASQFGLNLTRSKSEFETGSFLEPDPCEFRFVGGTINLEVPARIALRVLNKIKKGTFNITELEKKSKRQYIKYARAKE